MHFEQQNYDSFVVFNGISISLVKIWKKYPDPATKAQPQSLTLLVQKNQASFTWKIQAIFRLVSILTW